MAYEPENADETSRLPLGDIVKQRQQYHDVIEHMNDQKHPTDPYKPIEVPQTPEHGGWRVDSGKVRMAGEFNLNYDNASPQQRGPGGSHPFAFKDESFEEWKKRGGYEAAREGMFGGSSLGSQYSKPNYYSHSEYESNPTDENLKKFFDTLPKRPPIIEKPMMLGGSAIAHRLLDSFSWFGPRETKGEVNEATKTSKTEIPPEFSWFTPVEKADLPGEGPGRFAKPELKKSVGNAQLYNRAKRMHENMMSMSTRQATGNTWRDFITEALNTAPLALTGEATAARLGGAKEPPGPGVGGRDTLREAMAAAEAKEGERGRIPLAEQPEPEPQSVGAGKTPPEDIHFRTIEGGGQTTPRKEDNLEAITGGKAIREQNIDKATDTLVDALKAAKEGRLEPTGKLPEGAEGKVKEAATELQRQAKLVGDMHFEDMAKKPGRWNDLVNLINEDKVSDATIDKIFTDNPSFHDYYVEEFGKTELSKNDEFFESFKKELIAEVDKEMRSDFKLQKGGLALRDELQKTRLENEKELNRQDTFKKKERAEYNPELHELHQGIDAATKRALAIHKSIVAVEKEARNLGSPYNAQASGLVDMLQYNLNELKHLQNRLGFAKAKGPTSVGAAKTPEEDVHYLKNTKTMTYKELYDELDTLHGNAEDYKASEDSMVHAKGSPMAKREADIHKRLDEIEFEMIKAGPRPKGPLNAASTPRELVHYQTNEELQAASAKINFEVPKPEHRERIQALVNQGVGRREMAHTLGIKRNELKEILESKEWNIQPKQNPRTDPNRYRPGNIRDIVGPK